MGIKRGLLLFFLRQTLPATLIGLPIACLYVLFSREVLQPKGAWPFVFILVHSLVLVQFLGRFRSSSFAFVYSRGYSRDSLWLHIILASAVSALLIWLPTALIMWTHLRSLLQDYLFFSPYFPIMAQREAVVPWFWLAGYAIFLPVFHYVWIRRAQPMRDGNGAVLLAAGMVTAIVVLMTFRRHKDWFVILTLVLSIISITTSLIAGFLLHRKLEVQK